MADARTRGTESDDAPGSVDQEVGPETDQEVDQETADDEPEADLEDLVAEDDDLEDLDEPEDPGDPEDSAGPDDPASPEDDHGSRPGDGREGGSRSRAGARGRPRGASSRSASGHDHAPSALQRKTGVSRLTLVLVMLLSAAVVIIIQQAGRDAATAGQTMPADHPSVNASAASSDIAAMDEAQPVDSQKEASLKAEAQADPKNTQARQELGLMYLEAALYQDAATWLQQILDVDPDNMDALLAIGFAEYQLSDYKAAEKHWRHATEVSPDTADPWYYLGFLYMAQTPADTEQATQCWNKVQEIDPDSDMAATVRNHQQEMGAGPSSAATGTPSAATGPASPGAASGTPTATAPSPSSSPTATSGG